MLTAVHDGGTGEDSTFQMNHFYYIPNSNSVRDLKVLDSSGTLATIPTQQ